MLSLVVYLFFFLQAEDGIRVWSVTGVQTCALPISITDRVELPRLRIAGLEVARRQPGEVEAGQFHAIGDRALLGACQSDEIGRGSCRGRVEISVGAGSLKKKKKKDLSRRCMAHVDW